MFSRASLKKDGPTSYGILLALLCIRLFEAFLVPIFDSDESDNYWEPTHYLLYRYGYQTWEYSPEFAIRSYSFLFPIASLIKLLSYLVTDNKVVLFYLSRCALALFCGFSEHYFYRALRDKVDGRTALITLLLSAGSAGFGLAAPSYLPTTFCMCISMLCYGLWLREHRSAWVPLMAFVCISAWPYSGIIGIPLIIESLFSRRHFVRLILDAVYSGSIVLVRIY
jgi:alpha-1,2-mannosyltransferase